MNIFIKVRKPYIIFEIRIVYISNKSDNSFLKMRNLLNSYLDKFFDN